MPLPQCRGGRGDTERRWSPLGVMLATTVLAGVASAQFGEPTPPPTAVPTALPTSVPTAVPTAVPSPSPTASPTSLVQGQCPNMTSCLSSPSCLACIEALRPAAAVANQGQASLIPVAINRGQTMFFTAASGPACSSQVLPGTLFSAAFSEIGDGVCASAAGVGSAFPFCWLASAQCASDRDCRTCVGNAYALPRSSYHVVRSSFCNRTEPQLIGDVATACQAFPSCTYFKLLSEVTSQTTAMCYADLQRGDVGAAVERCGSGRTARVIDSLVTACAADEAVACEYWQRRLAQTEAGATCLSAIDAAGSLPALVAALTRSQCVGGTHLSTLLENVFGFCPEFSNCDLSVFACISSSEQCGRCLNGTAAANETAVCGRLRRQYFIDSSCAACPAEIAAINRIVIATAVVGGVSVVVCLFVVVAIVAYSHDTVSVRHRVIIGLMLSNAAFSSANAIPLNLLKDDMVDCGELVMSFDAIQSGRAWWFAGKYALACFEVFVLAVSISALARGTNPLSHRVEAVLHGLCVAVGVAAFIYFYLQCGRIMADGYNAEAQSLSHLTNARNYLNADDDRDDDQPGERAAQSFDRQREKYDNLEQHMLQLWLGLLGLSVLLWIVLRVQLTLILRRWHDTRSTAERQWDRDLWDAANRGQREVKARVMEAIRLGYEEVARPLEPFVAVFVVFGVPAAVMATNYCQDESGATTASSSSITSSDDTTYGTCDVWCEFVLAFRSLGTVAVYFLWREYRMEALALRTLWRRLRARMCYCFAPRRHASGVRFRNSAMLEEVLMIPPRGGDADDSSANASLVEEHAA